jgi:hypothetical protein
MQIVLPTSYLLIAVPALVVLGLALPPRLLLLGHLGIGAIQGYWSVMDVRFDATDLLFLSMGISLLRRGGLSGGRVPFLRVWLALGLLLSCAYVAAPESQAYLTSPAALAYQLYKYCWRPLLYYPLAVLLLHGSAERKALALGIVLSADVFAVHAILEGYSTGLAQGFWRNKNTLGAAMVIPSVVAASGFLSAPPGPKRWFYVASLLAVARTLTFAGSRGGFLGTVAACGAFALFLSSTREGRANLARGLAAAVAAVVIVFIFKPDIMERPTVQRLLTATKPFEEGTFRWRLEERWPHFAQKIRAHPRLGIGKDVDPELGEDTNTPHSGYLSLAVTHGVPAAGLYVIFALLGLRSGLIVMRRGPMRSERFAGAAVAGGIVGILVHNVTEATISLYPVGPTLWMIIGSSVVLSSNLRRSRTQVAAAQGTVAAAAHTARVPI